MTISELESTQRTFLNHVTNENRIQQADFDQQKEPITSIRKIYLRRLKQLKSMPLSPFSDDTVIIH